jgi:hypothetical protein
MTPEIASAGFRLGWPAAPDASLSNPSRGLAGCSGGALASRPRHLDAPLDRLQ